LSIILDSNLSNISKATENIDRLLNKGYKVELYYLYNNPAVCYEYAIKREVGILTGAVGMITDASQAEQTLRNGEADAILLGRELLRNPYWPLNAQVELDGQDSVWPPQYVRARR